MASRRLDAKIKQYMRDNPGMRYQKARDAVSTPLAAEQFPSVAIPDVEEFFFAHSPEDVLSHYPEFRLRVGVAHDGSTVTTPISGPLLVVGGTGSGKTALTQNFVWQFRAAGFKTIIMSGKPFDFTHTAGVDVRNVFDETAVHDLLRDLESRTDAPTFEETPPLAVVVEELTSHTPAQRRSWDDIIERLPSAVLDRVHFVIATNSLHTTHVPREVVEASSVRIIAGKASPTTLANAAIHLSSENARAVHGLGRADCRYRGRVHVVSATAVEEAQAYWIPSERMLHGRALSDEMVDKVNRVVSAFEEHEPPRLRE